MKKLIATLFSIAFLATATAFTQPGSNLASSIMAARAKSDGMLRQYNWNTRTDITKAGTVQETKIEQVSIGPSGQLQAVVLNDTKAPLPFGFLRKITAENERKELDKYLQGLHQLVGSYTLSGPGAMSSFISNASITAGTSPEGTAVLTTTGSSVIVPGDTVSFTFNGTSYAARRIEVTTTFNGDAVTITTTFRTLPNGLTHPQYTTANVASKQLVVQIHNYDYTPND